jgi:hypothetical protein
MWQSMVLKILAPTSAVVVIRNDLEHEYPHSEIIQKIKNKAVGP